MSHSAKKSQFSLSIQRQSASAIEQSLDDGRSVFIGKTPSCGIQVKGQDVADIHCLIDVDGEEAFIQDWASKVGTLVNGQIVEDKTAIKEGDRIQIGAVELLVVINAQAKQTLDAAASTPPKVEPREESVGMEHLGLSLEKAEESVAPQEPPVSLEPPAVRLSESVNRLSDTIAENRIQDDELIEEDHLQNFDPAQVINEAKLAEAHSVASNVEQSSEGVMELCNQAASSNSDSLEMLDDPSDPWGDTSENAGLSAADLDWDPAEIDDDQVDAEIVQLLKSEIEDLRIQVAERDEQLAELSGMPTSADDDSQHGRSQHSDSDEFGSVDLVQRVDDLLAELEEHDERVATLQELLQVSEIQNQAEQEERNCLEQWLNEIEKRIGDRDAEWQAEQDSLRERLVAVSQERDQTQQQLHAAAQRYGGVDEADVVADDTLKTLQQQNAKLQSDLEETRKQLAHSAKQAERLENEEPPELQQMRAELAKEKAAVSRLRFQLSEKLQDITDIPDPKDQPDREFAYKLQTLREHLREIHEEEKVEREEKGESLLGRISGLWKRVDNEY